jgi:hypothetical protein
MTVADRTLARGAATASPGCGSRCLMGRSIRRNRLVSSCTRMVPIFGRITDLGCPSPTRIPSRPLGPSCFGDESSRGAVLAPVSREADLALHLGVSSERSAKINGGLLEHLGGDLRSPGEAGHLFRCCPVWCHHEHAARALTRLPTVERVDQVRSLPRHRRRQIRLHCS